MKKKTYRYPDPDEIEINESDLKLKLREYSDAIRRKGSPFDLLIIIPAWVPIFTSSFRGFFGISGLTVKGFYFAIVLIGTVLWFSRIRYSLVSFYKEKIKKGTLSKNDKVWLKKYETDSSEKVSSIKSECKKK